MGSSGTTKLITYINTQRPILQFYQLYQNELDFTTHFYVV